MDVKTVVFKFTFDVLQDEHGDILEVIYHDSRIKSVKVADDKKSFAFESVEYRFKKES